MGGKSGSKPKVYFYRMSIDYAICHGPIDSVNEIRIKDKTAYVGPVVDSRAIQITESELFGGKKKEGGVGGILEVYTGSYVQKMSSQLAARFKMVPNDAPGYRGLAHVFFRGGDLSDGLAVADDQIATQDPQNPLNAAILSTQFGQRIFGYIQPLLQLSQYGRSGISRRFGENFEYILSSAQGSTSTGFTWIANNPYLPETEIGLTRLPRGLEGYESIYPIIGVDGNGEYIIAAPLQAFETEGQIDHKKLPDANPASMLYELKTNSDWGKGDPESIVDTASYIAAAATLASENFGLSMGVYEEEKLETVAGEILDHIRAVEFQHPRTGLWTLKLIRGDYDVDQLPVIDPSNSDVQNIKRRLWGETINKIYVEFTNPDTEEGESVGAENLANIMVQGRVISETRDYHAIRNPWLASTVAERDVAEASRTLTSATIHANRIAEDLLPGGVFRFNWPEENISGMIMRVLKIDYGNAEDRRIKIEAAEDVFATPLPAARPVALPDYVNFNPAPTDAPDVFITTLPLPLLLRSGVDPATVDDNYPQVTVAFMVGDPQVNYFGVAVIGDRTLANGEVVTDELAVVDERDAVALPVPLVPEIRSTLGAGLFNDLTDRASDKGLMFVVGDSDARHELIILDTYDQATNTWTVIRGVHDTIPESWEAGTNVRLMVDGVEFIDPTERLAGGVSTYNFLPETSLGRLNLGASTTHTYTPVERPFLPFRPANVQIDGNGFGHTQYLAGGVPATVTITWADRNRFDEDAIIPAWNDAASTPETGQTVTIRARSSDTGELEFEVTGLTGGTYTLDLSNLQTYRFYDIEVLSVRDSFESFRTVVRTLEIERLGYGNNYGFDYSENDGDTI